jgi:hypothetical protein
VIFRGRKKAKAVLNGYPIRIHDTTLKAYDTGEPIFRKGKEATASEVATYFLDRAVTHGITKGAQRLLEAVLAKSDVDPDEVDALAEDEVSVAAESKNEEASKSKVRDNLEERRPEIDTFKKSKRKAKRPPDDKAEETSESKARKKAAGKPPGEPASPSVVGAICAELKIEPKDARKKLRAAGMSAPYTDADKIRSVLTATPK